jgi:hypothetical protein
MPLTHRSFTISNDLYRRLNIASASLGMSTSEYLRGAATAALATHAEHDSVIATVFRLMDERSASEDAEHPSEAVTA